MLSPAKTIMGRVSLSANIKKQETQTFSRLFRVIFVGLRLAVSVTLWPEITGSGRRRARQGMGESVRETCIKI